MRRKLLFVLAIAVWTGWQTAPAAAMRPGCGDGVCQTNSCAGAPTGTTPGDGCEEDLCSCATDCEGIDTYASGNDGYCDSCHGEAGTPDCQGPCQPNWVVTSETVVGYVEEDHSDQVFVPPSSWVTDNWCESDALVDVHEHDTQECGPYNDRAYCYLEPTGQERHYTQFSNECCFYYGCPGYQYCPY